ncbi:hypothetical protein N9164_15230 [Draconibacterium sp.]|nr:hypothetical protein [Draconibacterium sp.]
MDTDLILLEKFAGGHPMQAAQTIEGFQEEEIAAILNELPTDLLVGIVTFMNRNKVAKCLKLVESTKAYALIENMDVLASESILRQSEEDLRDDILSNISTKTSSAIRQKLKHKAFTIGSLMHPLVFSFKKEQTVKDATAKVKQEKKKYATVIPVVNAERNVEGVVKIQDLFLEKGSSLIEAIMKTEIPKFSADMSIESIINHPGWCDYQSIPVIDPFNKLMGILDFETVQKHKIKSDAEQINLTAETAGSLGELYRVGLSGFLHGISK